MTDIKTKKVYIFENSGCIRRKLDTKKISVYLSLNGYEIVDKPDIADIIIFIGCGVTTELADSSLFVVKKLQKYNAELIVTGCIPAIEEEKLNKIFTGKKLATKDLDKIDELFPDIKIKFKNIDDPNYFYKIPLFNPFLKCYYNMINKINSVKIKNRLGSDSYKTILYNKKTFIIRVGWGCFNSCAYCATKKAIGPLLSKPINECVSEFKKGLKEGNKYFILTADDTGAYGVDIKNNLITLLDEITNIPGNYEIFVVNFNPQWVVKYIDDLESLPENQRKKITHFEIPIQSGSERILKLMNRLHDIEKIKDSLKKLKKAFPGSIIETNIMPGFPTETDADFEDSLKFLNEIKINCGYFMSFQNRPGTIAEAINPKVTKRENTKRIKHAKRYLKKAGYTISNRPFRVLSPSKTLGFDFAYFPK